MTLTKTDPEVGPATAAQTLANLDQLAIVDTETIGLDPERHAIYEVALLLPDDPEGCFGWEWWLPVDLSTADPYALSLGHYYQRWSNYDKSEPAEFARTFAELTAGRHLVGAVPSFDALRLEKLLRAHGACPAWNYHLVDVEALAAGKLGVAPPWDSKELSRALGVEPPGPEEHHTALGDVMWAWRIYQAVMASPAQGADR